MSNRRYGIIGCRPPSESSKTYDQDILRYADICESVLEFVCSLSDDSVVVSGGARGVDSVAVAAAKSRGLKTVEHLPDYHSHAKMAPLVRNVLIVDDCDEVVAFPAPWSTGTWHAVTVARNKNKPVCVKKI